MVNALTATLDLVDVAAADRARLEGRLKEAADRRGRGKKGPAAVVPPPAAPPPL